MPLHNDICQPGPLSGHIVDAQGDTYMSFGMNVKVDVPKVDIPKVDVSGTIDGVKNTVSGAIDSAKTAVNDMVDSAKDTINSAIDTATNAVNEVKESLSSVAGAIADVAVSFTGAIEDIALEPHLQLDANASFSITNFEKGPIMIRVEMTPDEAQACTDKLHLYSASFNEQKMITDFKNADGKTIGVLFEDAPMSENFTLEIIHDSGAPSVMFSDIPYGNLRKSRQGYLN